MVSDKTVSLLEHYFRDNPATAAKNLESLPLEEASEIAKKISNKLLIKIVHNFYAPFALKLIKALPEKRAHALLKQGGAELASNILLGLSSEQRKSFVNSLPESLKTQTQEILTFPEDSVGYLMQTDFLRFTSDLTVALTIKLMRAESKKQRPRANIYVSDPQNVLLGVLGIRDVLLAESNSILAELMHRDIITLDPFASIEDAAKIIAEKKFLSIPIVNAQKQLIGIVRASALIENAEENATQDIQKLFGVSAEERAFSPVLFCLQKRLPWLHINLVTAFAAASVVALFEDLIARITVLAIFLPVVAGQGGNAGAQSLAVVMRGIVLREIPRQDRMRLLKKESMLGLINGLVVGIVTGIIAWLWVGNPYIGVVIALAMVVNLTAAGLAGAAVPIVMKELGLDPAQSSSIVLTTITDIVGFFAYLGFAMVFQNLLL